MRRRNSHSGKLLFFLVWLLFLAKASIYIAITPLWEGFDELFHFAYVHSLASGEGLPVWGTSFVDADIADSTALAPLPEFLPVLAEGGTKLSHSEYWRIDPDEREQLEEGLHALRASPGNFNPSGVPNYQIQHPPLYYFLCVPIFWITNGLSLVDKLFAIRFFSALLASLCVGAAWLAGKEMETEGFAFPAILATAWPCLFIDIARVGNDCLGIAVFSFLFLHMIRYAKEPSRKTALIIGIFTGLGLITKAYFLAAVPAVVVFMIATALLKGRTSGKMSKQFLLDAVAAMLCAAAIGGWWYARNHMLYGSFSGLQESILNPSVGPIERIRAVFAVSWAPILKNFVVTFCWVSGWSFLHLPKALYLIFAAIFGVTAAGIMRIALSYRGPGEGKRPDARQRPDAGHIIAAFCLLLFFALGIAYHQVNAFATAETLGGPGGWYLYALLVPICFLTAAGLGAWQKHAGPILLIVLILFAAAEWGGILLVLVPYYTGMSAQAASGWGVDSLGSPGILFSRETLGRLLANKPSAFSPALLLMSSLGLLALQAALFCFVFRWTIEAQDELPEGAPQ